LKLAVVANTSWYIYNFRRNLMKALERAGHQVVAIGGPDDHIEKLQAEGFRHLAIPAMGSGLRPWHELKTIVALRRALHAEAVDLVLSYTPKANLYAAFALLGTKTRSIPNVSGLGAAFVRGGWLAAAVQVMYRIALRRASWVVFQNPDDHIHFIGRRLVDPERALRVPGSGVDLARFAPSTMPNDDITRFLMVSRLIWEKGVGEFIAAARIVRLREPSARFVLLGPTDNSSRRGVPSTVIDGWVAEGIVEYAGSSDDVRPHLVAASCVVLPSYYREGVPRSLLEAAAMARPIITTDAVGCREVVDEGLNGYLCQTRDAADLADKMTRFLALTQTERARMGRQSRLKAERQFDERIVIARYLEMVERIDQAPIR
jgi:glycosyltransferase involved in cell wall biosynthesis